MDPNETLAQLRESARVLGECADRFPDDYYDFHIPDLFKSLDEWLSRGGFLPTAWKIDPNADR